MYKIKRFQFKSNLAQNRIFARNLKNFLIFCKFSKFQHVYLTLLFREIMNWNSTIIKTNPFFRNSSGFDAFFNFLQTVLILSDFGIRHIQFIYDFLLTFKSISKVEFSRINLHIFIENIIMLENWSAT